MNVEIKPLVKPFSVMRHRRILAFTFISAALIGFWFGADPLSKMAVFVLTAAGFMSLFVVAKFFQLLMSKAFRF